MQKYRVMIHGQNLLREIDGVRQRYGFFTNVFVEAFTPADAESRAIDILREDAHLGALNASDDPVRFAADEVHEIESFDAVRLPSQGLSLYEEKGDDDFASQGRSLMTIQRQIVGLLISLAVAFAAAAIGGWASIRAPEFYQALVRPSWAPAAGVFGPVWSVLYLLMGISSWLVWRERGRAAKAPLSLYAIQLGLNALWSWLFFAWRQGQWAFAEIIVLWFFISATLVSFYRVRPLAGLLMLPYLVWVSFASALAFRVWRLNPTLLG